jgi:PAS domain S-box-containing protein
MGVLQLYILLTLLSFIVNFGFGVVTLTIDYRNQLNRSFAILVFALSWWALMKLAITLSPTADWAEFFYRLSGLGWCLLPAYYVNLTFEMIRKRQLGFRRWVAYVVSFLFLGLYVALWIGDLMLDEMIIEDWGYTDVPGPLFRHVFQPLFLLTFVYVIVELAIFASVARTRDDRMKGILVLVGLLIPLVGGAVTNMILPSFGIYVFELAVPLTTVNAAIIAFAMWRYRLMSFRIDYVSSAIISTMKGALLVVNPDGRIGIVSPATMKILGYDKSELVGMHVDEILEEKSFAKNLKCDLEKEGRVMIPARWITKGGDCVPVSLSASKLLNDRDKTVGYVIVGSRLYTTDGAGRVSIHTHPSDASGEGVNES